MVRHAQCGLGQVAVRAGASGLDQHPMQPLQRAIAIASGSSSVRAGKRSSESGEAFIHEHPMPDRDGAAARQWFEHERIRPITKIIGGGAIEVIEIAVELGRHARRPPVSGHKPCCDRRPHCDASVTASRLGRLNPAFDSADARRARRVRHARRHGGRALSGRAGWAPAPMPCDPDGTRRRRLVAAKASATPGEPQPGYPVIERSVQPGCGRVAALPGQG